jgi:hypothetical protein
VPSIPLIASTALLVAAWIAVTWLAISSVALPV